MLVGCHFIASRDAGAFILFLPYDARMRLIPHALCRAFVPGVTDRTYVTRLMFTGTSFTGYQVQSPTTVQHPFGA